MSPRGPRPETLLLAMLAVLLAVSGCGRSMTAPAELGDGSLAGDPYSGTAEPGAPDPYGRSRGRLLPYPLAIGNVWDYDIHQRFVTIPLEGPPPVEIESHTPWRHEIIDVQAFDGRTYFIRREYNLDLGLTTASQFPMRQDRAGLYQRLVYQLAPASMQAPDGAAHDPVGTRALVASLERALASSPHRDAFVRSAEQASAQSAMLALGGRGLPWGGGGPEHDEFTLLRYPLRLGSRWIAQSSPQFARVVEARERLALPFGEVGAWRIRGLSELYAPGTEVQMWYDRTGLVRTHVHTVLPAHDEGGQLIGHTISDWNQVLVSVTLVGRELATSVDPEAGTGPE